MNMGYVSDTARTRTRNLFRHMCAPTDSNYNISGFSYDIVIIYNFQSFFFILHDYKKLLNLKKRSMDC